MSNAIEIGTVYQAPTPGKRGVSLFKLVRFTDGGAPVYVRWIKTTRKWSGQAYLYVLSNPIVATDPELAA